MTQACFGYFQNSPKGRELFLSRYLCWKDVSPGAAIKQGFNILAATCTERQRQGGK